MTTLRDIILSLAVLGLPIYLVVRGGWRGLVLAAPVMWILAYLAGEIQRAGDSTADRFGMAIWIVVGWAVSLAYCGVIYGFRQLTLLLASRLGSVVATKVRYQT